ncbi:MAG: M20/M25/M40 family metallo-hydrolase [Clostridiaceae bacterium]|nr:M20/M25/M40 family metallo-hydrolase [Clostridiaceae bacterium]
MNDWRERISQYLMAHQAEILQDLAKLMAFPSLEQNEQAKHDALTYVLVRAKEMGMCTGTTKEFDAGWAEIGGGDVTLGVLAHVDVVAVGDEKNWDSPPFFLTEKDGFYFGRGIEDDKGAVIMSLWGMKAVLDLGLRPQKRIRLIVGTSEESIWIDMEHYIRDFGMPDYSFSPDGSFPVYNIEKGYCDIVLRFEEAALSRLATAEAGESPNSVPSAATWQLVGQPVQIFPGKAVHSSIPWQGDNPILKLGAVAAQEGFSFGRFLTERFGNDFYGIRLGLDDGSEQLGGVYVGKTVCTPTVLRFDGKALTLNINIRFRAGLTRADIEHRFEILKQEYGFKTAIKECTQPMLTDPEQPFLQDMNTLLESFGLPTGFLVASGASYASTMKNCVSWGPVFNDDEATAHMDNERLSVSDFWKAMVIYTEYFALQAEKKD